MRDGYSTKEVAGQLGVAEGTVRRYITDGFLPEPGWISRGRRRERRYSEAWVSAAKSKLGILEEDAEWQA